MEVAERSLWNSWSGTMLKEVDDQMDTVEAYEMNGMCEDEGVKELNL